MSKPVDADAKGQQTAFNTLRRLPPLIDSYDGGQVNWKQFDDVDFDLLGYLLTCHLVIEHYLEKYLDTVTGQSLDWSSSRVGFAQKVALLGKRKFPKGYELIPAIKHLNSLRNRTAHQLSVEINGDDVQPIYSVVRQKLDLGDNPPVPTVLAAFTKLCCAFFAGAIASKIDKNRSPDESKADFLKAHTVATSSDEDGH